MNVYLFIPILVFGLVVSAAVLTWVERRMLGIWQDRHGPNRVGPFGALQWAADMIKIITKDDWMPPFVDKPTFLLAPLITMAAVLTAFAVVPLSPGLVVIDINVGLLFFLAMTSLGVYSVLLAGWASHSKYALLGGIRSSAQMISYEVFMGLSLMGVVMLTGSFSLVDIVTAQ